MDSAYGVKLAAMNYLLDWKEAQLAENGRGVHKEAADIVWRKPKK